MNNLHNRQYLLAWIESFRLRTLPLALTAIIMGVALAYWQGQFRWSVLLLTLITAALLQILSNLANDYGDVGKGSDKPSRIGPKRGMQKGLISAKQMKYALYIMIVLIVIVGISLIVAACKEPKDIIGFILLGLLAIIAAITYTVGRKAYGYSGFGDLSVLIFFGWVSVGGSYYLQALTFQSVMLLPATACGLMAVAVLNINNLRDIDSDRSNGKFTLAVRLGGRIARYYHAFILLIAVVFMALFVIFQLKSYWGWLFIIAVPFIYRHAIFVLRHPKPEDMRPLLVQMVKISLLINLLFSLGVVLS